jgi:prolyl-tRNA synthetase
MKLSKSLWQTYKETPAEAEIPSHQLMLRAGLLHKSGAGLYHYLPFVYRSIRKVEQIVREEMDAIDGQELIMSVVTPGELWQESGRWDVMGDLMLKFKDKGDRDLCISPTNEETVTDIFRKGVKSYKQLPINVYQINTKFRDEIRPRFGLMRAREFTMKDAYTFHMTKECIDEVYDKFFKAYCNILDRMGLEYTAVEADAGAMGSADSKTHEFQVLAETGEDEIVYCDKTGYSANSEKAQTKRKAVDYFITDKPVAEVSTPNMATIEDVCNFLKRPQTHSLKSLVYTGIKGEDEEHVLVLLLGDDELNEVKLKNYLGADHLLPAAGEVLREYEMPKGFIGPYGLKKKIKVLFDNEVDTDAAYVVGALKVDLHLENFIPKRDAGEFEQVDLRLAKAGDLTLDGKGEVAVKRGIEVGHIFQLGDKYTKAMSTTVLDQNGKAFHPLMGCYGFGVTRSIAASIEQNHDEKGIIWPKAIAPYHIYFALIAKTDEYHQLGEEVYNDLKKEGFEVIFDDRKAGPGFKFKDADLLGLPIRLVLGERDYKEKQEFEIVHRQTGEKTFCKREDLVSNLKSLLEKTK